MKASLIITTLNEAGTIKPLLKSISEQSLLPSEIIIVDAGSNDGTRAIIKKFPKVKLINQPDLNRSQARNLGIKLAKNKIIAVTDAGCRADQHWLECLTKPFKDKQVLSVAGYYRPVTKTIFQKCVAPFVAVMPDKFRPEAYLPSSRSLAFGKGMAWYPEELNYCEDLVFARKLKKTGKMAVEPKALVYWQIPASLGEFFTQVKNYASGDVRAVYWPHLFRIMTVFGRYLVFLALPGLFLIYLLWPLIKHFRYVRHWQGLVYLPLLQLTADAAVMTGSVFGIISRE